MKRALYSLAIFFALLVVVTVARHDLGKSPVATTTTTTSTTAPTTTVPVASTTVPANPTTCVGSDFHGVAGYLQGATGTITSDVVLTKVTAGSCVLDGWPRVTLIGSAGSALPSRIVVEPNQTQPFNFADAGANAVPAVLHVASGASVSFDFAFSDVPTGTGESCPTVAALQIGTIAGPAMTTVPMTYTFNPCGGGRVLVSPFFVAAG